MSILIAVLAGSGAAGAAIGAWVYLAGHADGRAAAQLGRAPVILEPDDCGIRLISGAEAGARRAMDDTQPTFSEISALGEAAERLFGSTWEPAPLPRRPAPDTWTPPGYHWAMPDHYRTPPE